MRETDEQRRVRRALSHWLTEQINRIPNNTSWQAGVREAVLETLNEISVAFNELGRVMQERYKTKPDLRLVDFYMKGGNAYKVSIAGGLTSGGDSDWDTQVVIDEWAPLPIVGELHALVEDVALEQLRQAGVDIANFLARNDVDLKNEVARSWNQDSQHPIEGMTLANYTLKYDDPQTIRRVFDHERTGFWFHPSEPLRDRANPAESKWMPGMVFNDAIAPFILYRLGYTWHAELKPQNQWVQGGATLAIDRPILMELIDITIPRRGTVEAIEVWDAIESDAISMQETAVGFPLPHQVQLPFPDLYYHLREQIEMLSEIADGSSRHQDKMHKRFERLDQIYNSDKVKSAKCEEIISVQAGVESIAALDQPGQCIPITEGIYKLIPGGEPAARLFRPNSDGLYSVNPASASYRYGFHMMMEVANAITRKRLDFDDNGNIAQGVTAQFEAARSRLVAELQELRVKWALSDDLVYFDQLAALGYIDLPRVGLSGIRIAAMCRVPSEKLQAGPERLTGVVQRLIGEGRWMIGGNARAPVERQHHSGAKRNRYETDLEGQDDERAVKRQRLHRIDARRQYYKSDRGSGYSSDCVCVFFSDNNPVAVVTLTTATEAQLAFDGTGAGSSDGRSVPTVPLAEIARQRKMAASLVQNYVVRTALSRQYEAGRQSLAGF